MFGSCHKSQTYQWYRVSYVSLIYDYHNESRVSFFPLRTLSCVIRYSTPVFFVRNIYLIKFEIRTFLLPHLLQQENPINQRCALIG